MSGWEGVRVGVTIDPAPFAGGSFAADEEFNRKNHACQTENAEEFNDFPLLPGRTAEEPANDERGEPKS